MKIIGLKAHEIDNVATIFSEVKSGDEIEVIDKQGNSVTIQSNSDIPFGHKIAIKNISKGDHILKYGESIGGASEDVTLGDYVHIHNLESLRGRGDLARGN